MLGAHAYGYSGKCDIAHSLVAVHVLDVHTCGQCRKCDAQHSIGRPCVRVSVSAPIANVRESGAAIRVYGGLKTADPVLISENVTNITDK